MKEYRPDGGPDENPRYPKVLKVAVDHFRKYNLEVYIAMTHTPGMSAYNYVERRMAPLSKTLAGVLLPHDTFRDHLDSDGKTRDQELERKNFQRAGEVLAEIWGQLVLDDHPVISEYVENQAIEPDDYNELWVSQHCRITRYMLQIVKCDGRTCCSEMRTSWSSVFKQKFLPSPVPVRQEPTGPVIPEVGQVKKSDECHGNLWQRLAITPLIPNTGYNEIPYDLYCARVKVNERVCKLCGIYYPSKTAVDRHRRGKGFQAGKTISWRPAAEELIDICDMDKIDDAGEIDVTASKNPQTIDVGNDVDTEAIPVISLVEILANSPFARFGQCWTKGVGGSENGVILLDVIYVWLPSKK